MGSVGWIPFKEDIIKALTTTHDPNDEIQIINFDIKYSIPIFTELTGLWNVCVSFLRPAYFCYMEGCLSCV